MNQNLKVGTKVRSKIHGRTGEVIKIEEGGVVHIYWELSNRVTTLYPDQIPSLLDIVE